MSEHAQGSYIPDDLGPKTTVVSRPDTGLCCVCGAPRPDGHLYFCGPCVDESIDRALRTEVAIAAIRERRVCEPVAEVT